MTKEERRAAVKAAAYRVMPGIAAVLKSDDAIAKANAKAKAETAYPRLVAALQEYVKAAHGGNWAIAIENARAVLKELGEADAVDGKGNLCRSYMKDR